MADSMNVEGAEVSVDHSTKATAAAYDAVAGPYEQRFVDELAHKPNDRALLDRLARRGTGTILDLGCGPGQIGSYLMGHGRPVIGIDISQEMVARASSRLTGAVVADALALPLATHTISDAVAFYSLIHLPRRLLLDAFTEMARVLQPGGQFLVSAHEGHGEVHDTEFLGRPVTIQAQLYTLDELSDAAANAGFEIVSAHRRAPHDNEGWTVRLYLVAETRSR